MAFFIYLSIYLFTLYMLVKYLKRLLFMEAGNISPTIPTVPLPRLLNPLHCKQHVIWQVLTHTGTALACSTERSVPQFYTMS